MLCAAAGANAWAQPAAVLDGARRITLHGGEGQRVELAGDLALGDSPATGRVGQGLATGIGKNVGTKLSLILVSIPAAPRPVVRVKRPTPIGTATMTAATVLSPPVTLRGKLLRRRAKSAEQPMSARSKSATLR